MRPRNLFAALALAALVSCVPALTGAPSPSTPASVRLPGASVEPSPSLPAHIAAKDAVLIRQSGNGTQQKLLVLTVAGGDPRQIPDGVLMPDGTTILTLDSPAGFGLALSAVDRRTGRSLRSMPLDGSWRFRYSTAGPGALSANGRWLALVGSTYNATNAAGDWLAHSEFGVVDTALTSPIHKIALDGSYYLDSISDDGRSLYLIESRLAVVPRLSDSPYPVATPSPSPQLVARTLHVYDLQRNALTDVAGEPLPLMNAYVTDPVAIGGASFRVAASSDTLSLIRLDLSARASRSLGLPTVPPPSQLPSDVPPGELSMPWSALGTPDGRTVYVVNGALGVVHEVDAATLTLRRTGKLAAADGGATDASAQGAPDGPLGAAIGALVSRLVRWIAPVADAKMMVHSGAALGSDGRTIYTVAVDGIRAIDVGALQWRTFVLQGRFMDLAVSPDGRRLYALSSGGRWMLAFDTRSGEALGQLDVGAYPQAIVAVDPE